MTDGLTERDRQGVLSALEAFPKIKRVVLFGSRAIGTFRGASDLDLALEGDDLKLADLVSLRSRIGRLELPFEADIVIRSKITNPDVEKHIQKYGRVFYQRKTTRNDWSGWREITLREAGVSLIDCDHRTPPPSETGYPYAAIPQLKQGRLDLSDARRITHEHFVEWTRKANPQPNDVVLSRRCNPGETAFVPVGLEFALGQNLVLLRADESKMFPPFLRWLVRGEKWWEQIEKFINVGAIFNSLRCADIPNFQLPIPPLPEQRAIASVLGTLDDKIELNRRMNETLEALAQSLFKSWFVDATQSALPKGWRAGTLGEVAENPRRGIQPREIKPGTAYIGLEHMPRRRIALSDWGSAEELESNKFEFKRGEILFGKLRPYFHKVGVAPLDGVCSTDVLVITSREPAWFGFVLGHVSSVELVNHTSAASTGTKMPRASWSDISRYKVTLPPKELAAHFTEKTCPLVERIIANLHESRTLAALRDALLPKLLSGELHVPQTQGIT